MPCCLSLRDRVAAVDYVSPARLTALDERDQSEAVAVQRSTRRRRRRRSPTEGCLGHLLGQRRFLSFACVAWARQARSLCPCVCIWRNIVSGDGEDGIAEDEIDDGRGDESKAGMDAGTVVYSVQCTIYMYMSSDTARAVDARRAADHVDIG